MKTYIIIFSLTQNNSFYTNLYTYLKSSGTWAMPFQGVWLVTTSISAVQIRDGLRQRTYKGDKVLVAPIQPNDWGTSNVDASINNWLKDKLG